MALPVPPPVSPMLAKASAALPDGRRLVVRAEVRRLPLHRLPRRRRRRARQPQRAPAHALLPRDPATAARRAARAGRRRRRTRVAQPYGLDFDLLSLRIHPGREPHQQARRRDPGQLRRLRSARGGQRRSARAAVRRTARPARGVPRRRAPARVPHPRDHRPRRRRSLVRPLRGRRARRRGREAARRRRTSRASAPCAR